MHDICIQVAGGWSELRVEVQVQVRERELQR